MTNIPNKITVRRVFIDMCCYLLMISLYLYESKYIEMFNVSCHANDKEIISFFTFAIMNQIF